MAWEKYFSSLTCKKCIFIMRNETDCEAPPQRDPPISRAKCVRVCARSILCLDVCVCARPPILTVLIFSDNFVPAIRMFNHRTCDMLTSCSHIGAHVYQVQVLPSQWRNTPECLLDLVLGVGPAHLEGMLSHLEVQPWSFGLPVPSTHQLLLKLLIPIAAKKHVHVCLSGAQWCVQRV